MTGALVTLRRFAKASCALPTKMLRRSGPHCAAHGRCCTRAKEAEWPFFPYESAFVHVREGLPGAPALFRTALTLRVEKTMRESGVLPKDAETEPCDSAWNEWAFLSFLLGSEAASLEAEDEEAVALWRGRVADFVRDHAALWLPDFLTRTAEEVERLAQAGKVDPAAERFYGALAAYGRFLLATLAERAA